MNKKELLNGLNRSLNRTGLKIRKHSPEILIVFGILGVVTSTVMACKATTKVEDIIFDAKDKLNDIHEGIETGEIVDGKGESHEYTKEDGNKDLTIVYAQTGVKLVRLYAPSIAVGALSIASIVMSNRILSKRNVALAAAYTAIDRSFKDYRKRVVERFGEGLDKELRYNIKTKEVEEIVVDENGKEEIVKTTVNVADPNTYSDYAKFFDESCRGWSKDPELNLLFLKKQQSFANQALKDRGFLFLNEVYEMLGIDKTKAGQIVGWIYDEKNPIGDNFVDFGIYNIDVERNRAFVNGYERTILLDFNVDGNILDMI